MRNPRKRELWVFNPRAKRNGIKKTSTETVSSTSTSSVQCYVNKKMPVITRAHWKQVNSSGVPNKVVEWEDCVSAIKVERNKTKKEKDTKKSKRKNSHRIEKPMKNENKVKGKVSKKETVQLIEKAPLTFKDDVEEEESNDDFEKTLGQDITCVLARQVVDKNLTFINDQDEKITCFRRKITRAIRRADILKLKGSLTGEVVHYPRDLALSNFSHSTLAAVETSKSMNLDQDMPLIPICVEKPLPGVRCKKHFRQEKKPIKPKVQLKPLDFLSVKKTTNFKIPKKGKEKVPHWVINGSLWQEALTVDDNGQFFSVENRKEKVPWAKKTRKRPCEVFQPWLVRGNFLEGDDCDWTESIRKEKILDKWRWREELKWKLTTTDHLMGNGLSQPSVSQVADDLYLSEEELGWNSHESEVEDHDYNPDNYSYDTTPEYEQKTLVNKIPNPVKLFQVKKADSLGNSISSEEVLRPIVGGPPLAAGIFRSSTRRLKLS